MIFSFKQFLTSLTESGNAVAQWVNGARADASDIKTAIKFVSKHTGIPESELQDGVLGSTGHVLTGHKHDSGDLDIAIPDKKYDLTEVTEALKKAVNGEAHFAPGLKTYSYAVPVSDSKKIQVDLMLVDSKDWAKFAYNTTPDSKYKGAVRNQIMFAVVSHKIEPGKDIVVKDKDGNVIARASRSLKFDTGIERLFKVAKLKKDGSRKKTLDKVTPDELKMELDSIEPDLKDKFEPKADTIVDPKIAVQWMFGDGVQPSDVSTAEKVIKLIKEKFSKDESDDIITQAKENLKNNKLPIPEELDD